MEDGVRGVKKLLLTNGEHTLLDDHIYEVVKHWRWRVDKYGYVQRNFHRGKAGQYTIFLHRFIMKPQNNEDIDHINRNPLDNRRANLRLCNRSQNNINSKLRVDNKSGYKGVRWHTQTNKWQAYIGYKGKQIHLGLYNNINEAIKERKYMERTIYGEFST